MAAYVCSPISWMMHLRPDRSIIIPPSVVFASGPLIALSLNSDLGTAEPSAVVHVRNLAKSLKPGKLSHLNHWFKVTGS